MTSDQPDGQIAVSVRGHVLVMTIDRPRKRNAITPVMLEQLSLAYTRLEEDPSLRCGLLTGTDGHFTAGLDMAKVRAHRNAGRPLWPDRAIDPLGLRAPIKSKPIVCAVEGYCYTSGIELMLAADVVIASETTTFRQHEVTLGMMAWGGATFRMTERAGWGNAMRLLLTGMEFDAAEAMRCGFVQEVCEAGAAEERGFAVAEMIARHAPLAVQETMASARLSLLEGPEQAAAQLDGVRAKLIATADSDEGMRSFLEKRPAKFRGG